MTTSTLETELTRVQIERLDQGRKLDDRYAALVMAAATDKEPDPDEVVQICDELGRELSDFQDDVEWRVKRIAAAKLLAELPKITVRLQELDAAQAAEDQSYGDAVKRLARQHDEQLAAIRDEYGRLAANQSRAMRAEDELRDTFNNGDVLDEERRLSREDLVLARELKRLDSDLAEGAYDEIGEMTTAHFHAAAANRLAAMKARPNQDPAALAAAESEERHLRGRVEAVHRKRAEIQAKLDANRARELEISRLKLVP